MYNYSKNIFPPILRYTYKSFLYEGVNGEAIEVDLPASLSAKNYIEEIDHIQVRIMSLNSDKNGLNRNLFPQGIMFIPVTEQDKDLRVKFKTVINGQNVFSVGGQPAYPTYYRMQIRLVEKNSNGYKTSYGQNPPEGWVEKNRQYTSEWSNSGILKTVQAPDFGLYGLDSEKTNVLKKPDVLIQGWYTTNDKEEALTSYRLRLYADGRLVEDSDKIYIKEHERTTLQYRFGEVFMNDIDYVFRLDIETATGYTDSIEYKAEFELSFVKLFNIIRVEELEDKASTDVILEGFQTQLEPSHSYSQSNWLADDVYNQLGEHGYTHFDLKRGTIRPEDGFAIPYDNFAFMLTLTRLDRAVAKSFREAVYDDRHVFRFTGDSGFTDYRLYFYKKDKKIIAMLSEKRNYGSSYRVNYYKKELKEDPNTHETAMVIGKNLGETIFEAVSIHENKFK